MFCSPCSVLWKTLQREPQAETTEESKNNFKSDILKISLCSSENSCNVLPIPKKKIPCGMLEDINRHKFLKACCILACVRCFGEKEKKNNQSVKRKEIEVKEEFDKFMQNTMKKFKSEGVDEFKIVQLINKEIRKFPKMSKNCSFVFLNGV